MRHLAAKGGPKVARCLRDRGPLQCIHPDPTDILVEKSRRNVHKAVETGKKCNGTVYGDDGKPGLASRRSRDICPGSSRTNAPEQPYRVELGASARCEWPEARRMVFRRWGQIETLAAELLEKKTLSRDDVGVLLGLTSDTDYI